VPFKPAADNHLACRRITGNQPFSPMIYTIGGDITFQSAVNPDRPLGGDITLDGRLLADNNLKFRLF